MSETFQAIRGMHDVLPDQAPQWELFEDSVREWLRAYGYRNIRTPILERTELFVRSIGEVTDIVEKEMYTFVDQLNGESLALRPEGTASCVRAAIEHHLLYAGPQRLYYAGPMFRHERPAKGRFRQFHQVGVEALGFAGPDVDAEHMLMCAGLWKRLGLDGIQLEINTLGSTESRHRYRTRLIHHLEQHYERLDEDSKRRLHSNPLRVLDSKNPAMQPVVESAPRLYDDLDEASLKHFEELQATLRYTGVEFTINPRLVRGLDYYNHTVFEWVTSGLGAQSAVCAGGRYDGLFGQLGGKPAPACGFAMGIERLLTLMSVHGSGVGATAPDAYVVFSGSGTTAAAWRTAEQLREAGLRVVLHAGGGGFKAQMRRADASGAAFAIVIGESEAAQEKIGLKPLRGAGEQITVGLPEALSLMRGTRD